MPALLSKDFVCRALLHLIKAADLLEEGAQEVVLVMVGLALEAVVAVVANSPEVAANSPEAARPLEGVLETEGADQIQKNH